MSNKIVGELETKEFYDLMQTYRHSPITKQDDVYAAYQSVKAYIEHLLADEREKVRENICKSLCYSCELTIRQLDLTAPSITEEKK